MNNVNLPQGIVMVPSNNPAWTDMVVNKPQEAAQQVMAGLPKQTIVTPNNLVQSVDPSINMTHVNPIR